MCFLCGPAHDFFGFRSVFHPWLKDLLVRYFQGRVFDRRRRNKPQPACRISSPSPRFGRSRLSFKSGTYCWPLPYSWATMSFNGRTRPADSSSSPLLTSVGSRPGAETSWPEASKILPDSSTCTGRVVDLAFLVDRDRITRTSGGIVDCGRRTGEQLLHCAGCVKNIKSIAGVFRHSLNVDAGRPILHRHSSCLNPLACAGELNDLSRGA